MLCKKSDYSDLSCYSLSADDWLCVDLRLFPVLFSLVPLKISRIKLRVLIKKLFTASITRKTGADAAASQQLLLLILHMAVKSCSRAPVKSSETKDWKLFVSSFSSFSGWRWNQSDEDRPTSTQSASEQTQRRLIGGWSKVASVHRAHDHTSTHCWTGRKQILTSSFFLIIFMMI